MKFIILPMVILTLSLSASAQSNCTEEGQTCPQPTVETTPATTPAETTPVATPAEETSPAVAPAEETTPAVAPAEETTSNETTTEEAPAQIKIVPRPCREVIVEAQKALGNEIDPQSFSSTSFAELNITVEELNNMTVEEQQRIYQKMMPLEVMVLQTLETIQAVIQRYAGTFYEYLMGDELQKYRAHRDLLKICTYEE